MMLELILLPLGFATGWVVAERASATMTTAMSALAIAVTIAVVIWLPFLQAVLGATGIAAGFLARRYGRQ